jgi:hypothetical protein
MSVIFVLPFFVGDSYVIWKNTSSHLGAQQANLAWIMNGAFMLMGSALLIQTTRTIKTYPFHSVCILFFSIALILTAVFRHAPIVSGLEYNALEDQLHSVFASVVGFSFTLLSFSTVFITQKKLHQLMAVFMAISSTVLSLLIFNLAQWAGIWQRIMFVLAFTWLMWWFKVFTDHRSSFTKVR